MATRFSIIFIFQSSCFIPHPYSSEVRFCLEFKKPPLEEDHPDSGEKLSPSNKHQKIAHFLEWLEKIKITLSINKSENQS